MSRKNYRAFAEMLLLARDDIEKKPFWTEDEKLSSIDTLNAIAVQIAKIFKQDNPRFDSEKFFEAAGTK